MESVGIEDVDSDRDSALLLERTHCDSVTLIFELVRDGEADMISRTEGKSSWSYRESGSDGEGV